MYGQVAQLPFCEPNEKFTSSFFFNLQSILVISSKTFLVFYENQPVRHTGIQIFKSLRMIEIVLKIF